VTRARVIFDWILGITLLAIGVVGFVLPLLQGWIFVLAGLAVLSTHSRHARIAMEWIKSKARKVRDRVGNRREGS
jgi:uncharacterized membrane protein YbaN (DUF454 family)